MKSLVNLCHGPCYRLLRYLCNILLMTESFGDAGLIQYGFLVRHGAVEVKDEEQSYGGRKGEKDEERGASGLYSSSRRRIAAFSIDVFLDDSLRLGLGVREIPGGVVVVQALHKTPKGLPGPAEQAGLQLGDVLLAINYDPAQGSLLKVISMLKAAVDTARCVRLQIFREVGQGEELIQRSANPMISELLAQGSELHAAGVLDRRQRDRFVELVLQVMATEEGQPVDEQAARSIPKDLNALVMRAKGLREALCVRILHARPAMDAGPLSFQSTVKYILRVEDVASGKEWVVIKYFLDFRTLHAQLSATWEPIGDLPFPSDNVFTRLLPRLQLELMEERLKALESYLHAALSLLTLYAAIDARCGAALGMLQNFVSLDTRLDPHNPPPVVDQKRVEVLCYQILNQETSPAAELKHLLMADFERDVSLADTCEMVVEQMASRVSNLHIFLLQQHSQQCLEMLECPELLESPERKQKMLRRAIWRQVELALFLPLRRAFCNELTKRLSQRVHELQDVVLELQAAPQSLFGIEGPDVRQSKRWSDVVSALRRAAILPLPSDQIMSLQAAAEKIIHLQDNSVTTRRRPLSEKPMISMRSPLIDEVSGKMGGSNSEDRTPSRKSELMTRRDYSDSDDDRYDDERVEDYSAYVNEVTTVLEEASEREMMSPAFGSDGNTATWRKLEENDHQDCRTGIVISADDFLPVFTFALVQAAPPQLLILHYMLAALADPEERLAEGGYCLASLEAAVHYILELSKTVDIVGQ